jgi:DNA-binding NarL/FixJ family response regulator
MTATVFIADDHPLIRTGVRMIIDALPGYRVVGEADDGLQAVAGIGALHPDLAVIDLAMPQLDGLGAIAQARHASPDTRLLVLSMHADHHSVIEALKAGAQGYLVKDAAVAELADALAAVLQGQLYLSRAISAEVLQQYLRVLRGEAPSGPEAARPLSARQLEVLRLMARGQSTRQIAESLGISVKTVETHRAQIMQRLDLHDVASLTRYAIRQGLVNLND